jgi:signal transduction histidine kinase
MADATPDPLPREVAWGIGVAITAFALAGLATRLADGGILRAGVGAGIVVLAGVWLFRSGPGQVLAAAVAMTAGIAVLGWGTSSNVGWFAVCVLAGCCVLGGRRWDGVLYWAAALVLFAAQWVFVVHDPGWGAWPAGTTFALLAAILVRREGRLTAELRAAQAGLLDRARMEERNRIARELHDVIAHSLTVSLLHMTSARVALEHAPDDAERALAEAERVGRDALDEVRATVGLLRDDDDTSFNRPQPGVGDLEALVAGFRGAGAVIDLNIAWEGERVNDIAGLTIYRIAQEALTNAAKHAPGAPVSVAASLTGKEISLIVESSGPPGHGRGLGLASMQERAAAVGGRCEAGPSGAGWLVRAVIPA